MKAAHRWNARWNEGRSHTCFKPLITLRLQAENHFVIAEIGSRFFHRRRAFRTKTFMKYLKQRMCPLTAGEYSGMLLNDRRNINTAGILADFMFQVGVSLFIFPTVNGETSFKQPIDEFFSTFSVRGRTPADVVKLLPNTREEMEQIFKRDFAKALNEKDIQGLTDIFVTELLGIA